MSTSKDLTVINALLDAAKAKHGSDYKVAKLLKRSTAEVSDMRHGRLNAQPEDHALIAALGGLDPEEALIRAILAKHANKPKGEQLLSVLGNALHRTGVAASTLLLASAGLVMTPGTSDARSIPARLQHGVATMCSALKRWRQFGECQAISA